MPTDPAVAVEAARGETGNRRSGDVSAKRPAEPAAAREVTRALESNCLALRPRTTADRLVELRNSFAGPRGGTQVQSSAVRCC